MPTIRASAPRQVGWQPYGSVHTAAPRAVAPTANALLGLQRTVGNQAVVSMIALQRTSGTTTKVKTPLAERDFTHLHHKHRTDFGPGAQGGPPGQGTFGFGKKVEYLEGAEARLGGIAANEFGAALAAGPGYLGGQGYNDQLVEAAKDRAGAGYDMADVDEYALVDRNDAQLRDAGLNEAQITDLRGREKEIRAEREERDRVMNPTEATAGAMGSVAGFLGMYTSIRHIVKEGAGWPTLSTLISNTLGAGAALASTAKGATKAAGGSVSEEAVSGANAISSVFGTVKGAVDSVLSSIAFVRSFLRGEGHTAKYRKASDAVENVTGTSQSTLSAVSAGYETAGKALDHGDQAVPGLSLIVNAARLIKLIVGGVIAAFQRSVMRTFKGDKKKELVTTPVFQGAAKYLTKYVDDAKGYRIVHFDLSKPTRTDLHEGKLISEFNRVEAEDQRRLGELGPEITAATTARNTAQKATDDAEKDRDAANASAGARTNWENREQRDALTAARRRRRWKKRGEKLAHGVLTRIGSAPGPLADAAKKKATARQTRIDALRDAQDKDKSKKEEHRTAMDKSDAYVEAKAVTERAESELVGLTAEQKHRQDRQVEFTDKHKLNNWQALRDVFISTAFRQYESARQLQTIARKRIVRALTQGVPTLLSIAGDIATLSGVGAAAGVGTKATASGIKLLLGGFREGKQLYHNLKHDPSKSAKAKQEKRQALTLEIFKQVADADSITSQDARDAKQMLKATGVDMKTLYRYNSRPAEQGKLVFEALAQRE